ncbi:MAG: peptidoglycan D,D-transpeptidase FtsI family protein [Planctomycetota bacterium]
MIPPRAISSVIGQPSDKCPLPPSSLPEDHAPLAAEPSGASESENAPPDTDDESEERESDVSSPPPRMTSWRFRLLSVCVLAGWFVILARLIQVQGAQREWMNARVVRQSLFSEVIPARPGDILDRNGQVLAMTVMCDSLYAVPAEIEDPWHFAWEVSSVLNLNTDELYGRLTENSDKQFVWIKRRIDEDQVRRIRALGFSRDSWGLRQEYLRKYPQGGFASHVIGIRDIDNAGKGGLEQSLNDRIRGTDGSRVMTRDARGKVIEVAAERSTPPVHGQTVISTIDLLSQIETERQLDLLMEEWKPRGACAIVMEPHSGEILAMASRPGFDPNSLVEVPEAAWKNLAVSAVFEPGSTFKPFIVGWALQHGQLRQNEMIDCSFGAYRMGPRILHDHHSYGALSVEDVLVKSSNIGMAKIGERIGLEDLYEATRSFGFGRRTGVELPGELTGLLHPFSKWTIYSLGSIPMGQELAVTPLQLITAHAAIANGGQLLRPRLLKRAAIDEAIASGVGSQHIVAPAENVGTPLLDSDIAEWLVREPMKQVVERGTGKQARIPGMSIFGKTGTAQKLDPETGTYSDTAWVVSFVCGAPAEDPRVIVLLMVDEPTAPGIHYGGTVAAPAASRMLQFAESRARSLGLPRNQNDLTQSPAGSDAVLR